MKTIIALLTILMVACEVNPDPPCTSGNEHKWGKWEEVERPKNYGAEWLCMRRSCTHCGYIQTETRQQ